MNNNYNKAFTIVCVIAVMLTVPFLGLTDFYSKGEPREAVVAYTMVEHGNWILPINNGGDIPYKPPFFHWCIALFSLLQGHVSEFTSRLPSALALVAMSVGGFVFFAKRKNANMALLATLLSLTAFEVHRAGINCRVDMVNTAFMVGALFLMFRWWERGKHTMPWLAILCMSGATLTKGPVGMLLPCAVMGVFMLTQRESLWSTVWRLGLTALLSLVLPLCWYYAAYLQGGDEFLRLVKEENIDRLLGKMAYESHENPFWYNFLTLITGWLPYTLLFVFSLFVLPWKRFSKSGFMQSVRRAEPMQVFVWLAFGLILFFYCIPKSKRSVYLLPCYPFMAWLMAQYVVWLVANRLSAVKAYAWLMGVLGVVLSVAFVVLKTGVVPDTLFHGKHAADNIAMLHALESISVSPSHLLFVLLPAAVGVATIMTLLKKDDNLRNRAVWLSLSVVVTLFLALDSTFQPAVLNTKADKPLVPQIEQRFDMTKMYSYMSSPMLHFFSLNFYLGDRIQQFEKVKPEDGVLMIPEDDVEEFKKTVGRGYCLQRVWQIRRAVEEKHEVGFYKFCKREKLQLNK
ncbi:MAG: glycosyltransferase family 39 protein [Prevotella sp.]|nr:glycosyltransferase family 39 protein [Prevotella sp.]